MGRKLASFPSYADLASILLRSSLTQNSSFSSILPQTLFARGVMGSQAQGRMPEVKSQGEGPQQPEVEELGVGQLQGTQDRGRVLRTDIWTVGLPRPLEANTKIREIYPFSVLVPTNK